MTSHPLPRISAPAARALDGARITTLEQAAEYGEASLLELHGFGPKGIVILRAALAELGLELAD
ncbi:DNA-binding protein [Paeniglutamicibacter sp. MACA_103]|uniref:DNA-binding protein n=1 Tax=Paeniglutamicibacter sp. MACA_103 TaxID=3377337 RepID=UPI0038954328